MYLTWRERLDRQPEWADFNLWPVIDPDALALDKVAAFRRNWTAVGCILKGMKMKEVAHTQGMKASSLTRLMTRCLGGEAEETPALSSGLIPGSRLKSSQRYKPLDCLSESSGAAHSFKHIIATVPGLKEHLDKAIKKSFNQNRQGENLTPKSFHKKFISYLKGMNWPHDTYPFTVKSRGYETCRQYLKQQRMILSMPKSISRIILPVEVTSRFGQIIEIDDQCVDCHGSVNIILNKNLEPQRVSRVHLLENRDVATNGTLGHVVSLTKKPTGEDILYLLEQMVRPCEPIPLTTPGLKYPPGGCLPSALGGEARRVIVSIVRMDNALSHLANDVRDYVCNKLGATLNLGLVKQPKTRNTIEHAFAELNIDVHRIPSTTGSHTQDPKREPARHNKKAPIINIRTLEEVISVLCTGRNVRPLGNLGGSTPLATTQYQLAQRFLPLRPIMPEQYLSAHIGERQVIVHKTKNYAPHINFEGATYRGPALTDPALVGQTVTVRYDRRDIRQLHVITQLGEDQGIVLAPKTWQRFPHGLTTRKYINQLLRQNLIQGDDLLGGYFDYTARHRTLPSHALELVRISREFAFDSPISPAEKIEQDIPINTLSTSIHSKQLNNIPEWSPDMVKKRR